jgi:hypothetical protein
VRKLDTVEERQIGDIDSFLSSHGFRKRPRLTEGLASETVAQRMDLSKTTSSQMSIPQVGKTLEKEETKDTLGETRKVIRRSQETARRRLAAHFHSSHEMLRKSVLAHVDEVIQKWTVSKQSLYTLDVAKSELNKELAKYQDLAVSAKITYDFSSFCLICSNLIFLPFLAMYDAKAAHGGLGTCCETNCRKFWNKGSNIICVLSFS